jgi:hypothetical protein
MKFKKPRRLDRVIKLGDNRTYLFLKKPTIRTNYPNFILL